MNKELFNKAALAHANNQLDVAEKIYIQILNNEPANFKILFLLGTLYLQKEIPKKSIQYFSIAEKINPNDPHLLMNYGLALKEINDLIGSEKYLKKSLFHDDKNPHIYNNIAGLLKSQKEINEAISYYDKAINLDPNNDEFILNKCECLILIYEYHEAISFLNKINRDSPFFYKAQIKLFKIFFSTKNYEGCIKIFNDHKELTFDKNEKKYILLNTIHAAIELGSQNYARELLNKINKKSNDYVFYNALLLQSSQKYTEAIKGFEKLLLNSDYKESALHNLGMLHMENANIDKAIEFFKKTLIINQDQQDANIMLGQCYLAKKQFKKAWKYYLKYQTNSRLNNNGLKKWNGISSKDNILIIFDQGLGDQIFYAKFLNSLYHYENAFLCKVDNKLVDLFKYSFPNKFSFQSSLPKNLKKEFDFYCYSSDLASFFIQKISDIKHNEPYLRIKNNPQISKTAIGLSWYSKNKIIGRNKSIDLEKLIKALKKKSNLFINLQYGNVHNEIDKISKKYEIEFIDSSQNDNLNNILGLCDLILRSKEIYTISNTTAHLAGALGAKVNVLLPYNHPFNSWYWIHSNNNSLWYPNVKVIESKSFLFDKVLENLY